VQDIFDSVELVDSVAFVKEQLGEQHGIEIDYHRLKKIMKEELDLRYKKISPISWQGNSDRNKILRQQFAQTLMEVDISKKTIINIDESWLGKSDFRRFSWSLRGVTNSVPQKQVQPRISMIAGLDSNGQVYLSLVQANSNTSLMEMFFSNLILLLDKKDRSWRHKTLLLLDNAPYHTSSDMMAFYERHQLPILFTGPHSFAACPIETWFAHFKNANINPEQLPLGKT
jgi:hypothetical protein